MTRKTTIEKIEKEMESLSSAERLRLVDNVIRRMIRDEGLKKEHKRRESMYGSGKGLWDVDAQEYVNGLREDR